MSAAEVQFGDSVQVAGDGFALGKPIVVRFQGHVYRAGRTPRRVDVAFRAQAQSQHELSVPLAREEQASFCGELADSSHATFRGDLRVAIAAREPGAPPVTGTLRGATLELYPALETRAARERRAQLGRRALAFFGLELAEAPEGGMTVVALAPGGRAVRAGLQPGDRILRAAGSSVLEPSDLVPEPGRSLAIEALRGSTQEELRLRLDADGFFPEPPASLRPAALLLGAAALALVLWASPARTLLSSVLPTWRASRGLRHGSRASALGAAARRAPPRVSSLGALVWLAVGSAFFAPLIRHTPIELGSGLVSLLFGSSLLLVAARLIEGGRDRDHWSLLQGVRAARRQCLVLVPAWVAVLSSCSQSGIEIEELARAQGPLPWHWNAFSNPGWTSLLALALLSTLPQRRRVSGHLAHACAPLPNARTSLLDSLYSCSLCAVAAVAFLGGDAWSSSNLPAGPVPRLWLPLLAYAKYTGLCVMVAALRRSVPQLTLDQWAPIGARICLPLSLVAALLAQLWESSSAGAGLAHWVVSGFGPIVTASLALGLVLAAGHALSLRQRPPSSPGLSPWL